MTTVWRMNSTHLSVIVGWTRRGEKDGFCFYPGVGTRASGERGLPTESAPVPIFGGRLSEQEFREGLSQLVDPKLGQLFELTYDSTAATIHGRYPNSRNTALRTSCLLHRDIPADEELVPMVIFWETSGIVVSIVND